MTYAAGTVLETADGKIALHHRDDKPGISAPGKWAVFGGMKEYDEEPLDTVVRELYEELEIHLNPGLLGLLQRYRNKHDHYVYIHHYPVTNELDTAVLHEGQDWGLYTPDEIRQLDIVPQHLNVMETLWQRRSQRALYLTIDSNNRIGLPPQGIDWRRTIDTSTGTTTIVSAHDLIATHPYQFQFTHYHHRDFLTQVYTVSVTEAGSQTVDLSDWILVSPNTIDQTVSDFHIRTILRRYWTKSTTT